MTGPREFYDEIGSTQDRALELARVGAAVGTRVVARSQRGGRGRLDHVWSSPPGGLYLSIVLQAPDDRVTWLPLALGAGLAERFARRYSATLAVKWPNDLLLVASVGPARKLAGVLVDRVERSDGRAVEVAGVGVNVAAEPGVFPSELRGRAAFLAEIARPVPDLVEVEELVVEAVMQSSDELGAPAGREATRRRCAERLFGVGRTAIVDGAPGGTIAGLGDAGELLLDRGPHRVAIRAGDVRVEGVA